MADSSALLSDVGLRSVVSVQTLHDLAGITLLRCLKQRLHIHRELDSVSGWSGSEVVLAGLEAGFPGVEMHCRHLIKGGVLLVQVQRLRLTNVGASSTCVIQHALLFDLPNSFVDFTEVLGNLGNVLNAAIVSHDLILDGVCPKANLQQIAN